MRTTYDLVCPVCGYKKTSNSHEYCPSCRTDMYYTHMVNFRDNGTKDNESWHDQFGNWLNGYDYDENGKVIIPYDENGNIILPPKR